MLGKFVLGMFECGVSLSLECLDDTESWVSLGFRAKMTLSVGGVSLSLECLSLESDPPLPFRV